MDVFAAWVIFFVAPVVILAAAVLYWIISTSSK